MLIHLILQYEITFAMWFQPQENLVDYQGVAGKGGGSSFEQGYEFASLGSNTFGFWVNGAINVVTAPRPSNGELAHWVGTYDGTDIEIYKNGEEVDSTPYTAAITPTSLPFRVGRVSVNGGNKL